MKIVKQTLSPPIVVFMQVGDDPIAKAFVRSIRKTMPSAQIIQCSDSLTQQIQDVSQVYRVDGDTSNLMTFRLSAFSQLGLTSPAAYLDSDMLVVNSFDPVTLVSGYDVINCKRSFDCDGLFNWQFRGMSLPEHKNKTLAEVYPLLACFTVTKSFLYWKSCYEMLMSLDKKYHFWYGDQEVMKLLTTKRNFHFGTIDEKKVACLPEYYEKYPNALALHFKGSKRKGLFEKFCQKYSFD